MPTLEQQRQAIGAAMTASRTGGSTTQEQRRRAIGTRMTADRTGADTVQDIHLLARPEQVAKTLRTIESVGALPPARGRGVYVPPPATAGSGISSPLTERTRLELGVTVPDRAYWATQDVYSSDGLMTFKIGAIKTMNFLDADGNSVQMQFAAVPEPS